MIKNIIISGVSGQDGSWMADHLLETTPHLIYGIVRHLSVPNHKNIENALKNNRFKLVIGDLSDYNSIERIIKEVQPDFFINFGANSFVFNSWDLSFQHFDVNCLGLMRVLEAVRKFKPDCRVYSSGSSEEVGGSKNEIQSMEECPTPMSPYAVSKVAARFITKVYRESYGLFCIHGLLWNHESPGRRGREFISRKITLGVAKIFHAIKNQTPIESIKVGNIFAYRDWSDARDFVKAIWLMLNQDTPKEFCLASGESHAVKELIDTAFEYADIRTEWVIDELNPLNTKLLLKNTNIILVSVEKEFFRPNEVNHLRGSSEAIIKELGWKSKNNFRNLIREMTEFDIQNYEK